MAVARSGDNGTEPVKIQLLRSPDEWRLARDARLAALRDAPEAFLPMQPHESSWSEDRWRYSFIAGWWAVARANTTVIGIARLTHWKNGPHVESVWTHPRHRRRGIASDLVRLVVQAAREKGLGDVFVWVIQPNPGAFRLYESLGFEPTNERQRLAAVGRIEERLRLTGALRVA